MSEHKHHIASVGLYITIFAALMVLTLLTVGVTYVDLGQFNLFVALGIAIFKASLVILYFMHVRWSPKLVHVTILTSLLFVGILAAFTFADYLTRGVLGVAGR
ncbi:MAG: cytochrome C oxidase subunit IV family protein [Vicinamibacterales bacterium]|jgi:cytochrome c oxidase subunit 4|nr:cytochrome C oxidase subunit IV family protein [Vicinamibacterales bacterium]